MLDSGIILKYFSVAKSSLMSREMFSGVIWGT